MGCSKLPQLTDLTKGDNMKYGFLATLAVVTASAPAAFANSGVFDAITNVFTTSHEHHLMNHTWENEACTDTSVIGVSHRTSFEFGPKHVHRVEKYFASPNCKDEV